MKPAKQRAQLKSALERQAHVRIERSPEGADQVDGFVIAVGRKWALLQATRDGGHFDGFIAVRIDSVKRMRRDTSFEGAYARTLPEWPPTAPDGIDLDGTRRLLRSVAAVAPLLGIEQERRLPDHQWIGAFVGFSRGLLGLHQVSPQAAWDVRPSGFKPKRITMVLFGNGYMIALAAMAGDPPADEG